MRVRTANLTDIGQDCMHVWVGERKPNADKAHPLSLSQHLSLSSSYLHNRGLTRSNVWPSSSRLCWFFSVIVLIIT